MLPLQLGHWGVGDLQRLLWSDRVAAALGELPTTGKLGTAATICSQQTMWQGSSRGKTNLQPLPVPTLVEKRALDPGTTSNKMTVYWIADLLLHSSGWTTSTFLVWTSTHFDILFLVLKQAQATITVEFLRFSYSFWTTFTISTFTLYLICPNSRCFISVTFALSLD